MLKSSMLPSIDGLVLDVSEQRRRRLEVDEAVPCASEWSCTKNSDRHKQVTRMISAAEVEVSLMRLEVEVGEKARNRRQVASSEPVPKAWPSGKNCTTLISDSWPANEASGRLCLYECPKV